jgi:hypothetical protein
MRSIFSSTGKQVKSTFDLLQQQQQQQQQQQKTRSGHPLRFLAFDGKNKQ